MVFHVMEEHGGTVEIELRRAPNSITCHSWEGRSEAVPLDEANPSERGGLDLAGRGKRRGSGMDGRSERESEPVFGGIGEAIENPRFAQAAGWVIVEVQGEESALDCILVGLQHGIQRKPLVASLGAETSLNRDDPLHAGLYHMDQQEEGEELGTRLREIRDG